MFQSLNVTSAEKVNLQCGVMISVDILAYQGKQAIMKLQKQRFKSEQPISLRTHNYHATILPELNASTDRITHDAPCHEANSAIFACLGRTLVPTRYWAEQPEIFTPLSILEKSYILKKTEQLAFGNIGRESKKKLGNKSIPERYR